MDLHWSHPWVSLFFHNMMCPENGNIYSINEGSWHQFDPTIREYLEWCKETGLTARYIGSLVADYHRNMLKGGIYLYPNTEKAPDGKLRLLYECNALAFIAEQAGGLASDGKQRILDIQPQDCHQRTPFYIGSKNMVSKALEFVAEQKVSK